MTDQSPEKDTLDGICRRLIQSAKPLHYKWTEHDEREITEAKATIAQALRACVPEKKTWEIGNVGMKEEAVYLGFNAAIEEINANITAFIGGDSDE